MQNYSGINKKPDPIDKDARGTLITIGSNVAYNYSGSIALGKIKTIKNNQWTKAEEEIFYYWICKFNIEIENEDGHISTIKNPNSFIILDNQIGPKL